VKEWKFGIVGGGLIADFHARAIADIPNARLVGCYNRTFEKAQRLAEKYHCKAFADLRELLSQEDLDIVTIATASGAHMEPAVAAAQAGKHVICEKPLEVTLERIDAMIEAHKRAGTRFGGIFQNRFVEALTPLKEAVRSGRFGTITYAGVYVPWWRGDEYYKDSWHGTWKLDGGGALMNQSIHMIDLLLHVVGPVDSVAGFVGKGGHPQIETEDTAVAAVRFANGVLGLIYGTTASYPGRFKQLEITGTRGTVVYVEDSFTVWQFADEQPKDEQIRRRFGKVQSKGGVSDPAAIGHECHRRNFESFIKAVEQGRDFEISAEEARKSVELILAIYEAARQQKVVKLPRG